MTLLFDPYESVAMFLAGKHFNTIRYCHSTDLFAVVLTVNYAVQDGKSNWLEGFILMGATVAKTFSKQRLLIFEQLGLYVILAVTFWYYPGMFYPLIPTPYLPLLNRFRSLWRAGYLPLNVYPLTSIPL